MGCWKLGGVADDMRVFFQRQSETIEYTNFPAAGSPRYLRWKRFLMYGLCICAATASLTILVILKTPAKCDVFHEVNITTPTCDPEKFPQEWNVTDGSEQSCFLNHSIQASSQKPNSFPHNISEALVVDCPSYNFLFSPGKESTNDFDFNLTMAKNLKNHFKSLTKLLNESENEVTTHIWLRLNTIDFMEAGFCAQYASIANDMYPGRFPGLVVGTDWWSQLRCKYRGYHKNGYSMYFVLTRLYHVFEKSAGQTFRIMVSPSNCFNLASTDFGQFIYNFDHSLYWQEENRAYTRVRDNGESDCVDFDVYEECSDYIMEKVMRKHPIIREMKEVKVLEFLSFERFVQTFSATN